MCATIVQIIFSGYLMEHPWLIGAALDAAQRGLSVACIEREDFSSGTSSRSTKLIWGGSRYLVQAFVNLLSTKLFTSPAESIKRFKDDFRMVMNCHRERSFLLQEQPHLTKWLPIAVPLNRWLLYPPPFGFFPAIMGPLGLFPAFFKFVRVVILEVSVPVVNLNFL